MTNPTDLNRRDWSWLQNTYWYVLPENLPALQFDPDNNTLTWLIDQTVWHITGYRSGYFWGVSATLTSQAGERTPQTGEQTPPAGEQTPAYAAGSRPVCFTMLGTITPEGRVHLTFIPCQTSSSRSATIGIGAAVEYRGNWSFEMQMSSGSGKRTAHWAYMSRVQPGDPSWERLPGVKVSVPQMLKGCEPPEAITSVRSDK